MIRVGSAATRQVQSSRSDGDKGALADVKSVAARQCEACSRQRDARKKIALKARFVGARALFDGWVQCYYAAGSQLRQRDVLITAYQ